MAMFHASSASSYSSIATNNIPELGKSASLTHIASMPTTQNWRVTQDLTLISNQSKHHDYQTGYRSFTDDNYVKHAQKLKNVRHLLSKGENPVEELILVDAVQRLGIDYHFQEEIEAVLHRQYLATNADHVHGYHDLYKDSLCFRLLRQEGYHVTADVFTNFMGKEGKFKEGLSKDIRGLMSLYEASQLSVDGEEILDEAANFSSQLLNAWQTRLDHHQAKIVGNTLAHPYHRSLPRFMAKNFIKDFKGTNGLQELATMDFNMVQSIHQKEILQISRWWKDLGLAEELKFARDQPLKWCMWPMAMLTDPTLSEQRIELTKPVSFIYLIDDIFDVYGTLDELTLFTEAVNRWDFAVVEQLPDYMKMCFKALYDITNEISYKVYKQHGWNPIDPLRKSWATLFDAFLVEAKWFASGQMPKADEYLKNGVVSSGVHVVLIHMFFLLGLGPTKESADLVKDIPNIMSSVATILRLWDDLGSAKDENQDGHDGSYVQCYMKEHQGSSVEIAREHVFNMISDTWKRLNRECLSPNPFSSSFTKASLNLTRMVPLMYSYDDNHCLLALKHLKSMLYEAV